MPSNRLVNANQATRCQYTKVNGSPCGSPARHGRRFCCFHDTAVRRNREFVLPIIEDAASLQLALNKIMQALVDKLLDQKTATTLLYGLQIASANLKRLDGEQFRDKLDRMSRASRPPQRPQPSSAPPPSTPVSDHAFTRAPDHPLAEVQQGRAPVAQDASPGDASSRLAESRGDGAMAAQPKAASSSEPDLVYEFLRKLASQKNTNQKSQNEKEPRFDINACADLTEEGCHRESRDVALRVQ